MSLEWCFLRNDMSPKPHLNQLGAGAAPQIFLGHFLRSPWGNSPDLPGTAAHIPHWLTAALCHRTSQGSCVCAGASHACPHQPLGETFPPDPTHLPVRCFHSKNGILLGLAIYFLPLVYNPVLKDQIEASLSKLKHWGGYTPIPSLIFL